MQMIEDDKYTHLSGNEYFLYMLLLNRLNISKKKLEHFSDENGIFIYYSNKQITNHLNCSKNYVTKILKNLESAGLIRKEYQKRGLPLKIYVNDVFGIHNRTYDKATPQDKPKINHNQNFKSYSPTMPKQQEKKVNFDIEKTRQQANDGTLDFGNMKNKKRRHTSTF